MKYYIIKLETNKIEVLLRFTWFLNFNCETHDCFTKLIIMFLFTKKKSSTYILTNTSIM